MERKIKPLKKISVEESQKYLPVKDDLYSRFIYFYTVTPSMDQYYPNEDGWEDVKYFTKRLRKN